MLKCCISDLLYLNHASHVPHLASNAGSELAATSAHARLTGGSSSTALAKTFSTGCFWSRTSKSGRPLNWEIIALALGEIFGLLTSLDFRGLQYRWEFPTLVLNYSIAN